MVIVNNPHPQLTTNFTIQYYDLNGTPLFPASTDTLGPEETHVELAIPLMAAGGYGSARINADEPIVGGTLHHGYELAGCEDPQIPDMGMASLQQLQKNSENTTLYWGPVTPAF